MAILNCFHPIQELGGGDCIWRLDWLGDCGYPTTVRRYGQPSVKGVFSPLVCDKDDQAALLLPSATDHHHQKEVWLAISALPILTVGSLWQKGLKIAEPDFQLETFRDLKINPESASFIKAGKDIDGGFVLPLGSHPWHRLHTHAYCVMVSLPSGKRLVIPCIELIRFYFGSSSNFIQRLFIEPLGVNALWSSKTFDAKTQSLHLVLADRISGVSASDIGRIAGSQFAWRSAAGIYSSCMKASIQNLPIYPYTGFPLEGKTDLGVSGVWLPFGGKENDTFLVYQINTCTHPFPFKRLTYDLADSSVQAGNGGDGKSKAGSTTARGGSDKAQVVNKEPGNNKAQRSAVFTAKTKFPDLEKKPVWRLKAEAMESADVFLRRADGILEQIAFGESGYATDHAGLDLQQFATWQENKDEPLPQFVIDGLKILVEDPRYGAIGCELKVVCPPGKRCLIFNLPYIVNGDGEIEEESMYVKESGGIRQRRGCWVIGVKRLYLVHEGGIFVDDYPFSNFPIGETLLFSNG
ncbi:MAG: hypothetical protein ACOYBT_00950 [Polynucleobacter sp.]